MAVVWINHAPHERNINTLGKDFLGNVLAKMTNTCTVAFGQTGDGLRPNYQVTKKDGTKTPYRSNGHEEFGNDTDEFERKNVSREFSYSEIICALET